jgi:hypothetical protein
MPRTTQRVARRLRALAFISAVAAFAGCDALVVDKQPPGNPPPGAMGMPGTTSPAPGAASDAGVSAVDTSPAPVVDAAVTPPVVDAVARAVVGVRPSTRPSGAIRHQGVSTRPVLRS